MLVFQSSQCLAKYTSIDCVFTLNDWRWAWSIIHWIVEAHGMLYNRILVLGVITSIVFGTHWFASVSYSSGPIRNIVVSGQEYYRLSNTMKENINGKSNKITSWLILILQTIYWLGSKSCGTFQAHFANRKKLTTSP